MLAIVFKLQVLLPDSFVFVEFSLGSGPLFFEFLLVGHFLLVHLDQFILSAEGQQFAFGVFSFPGLFFLLESLHFLGESSDVD